MKITTNLVALALVAAAVGCGGGSGGPKAKDALGNTVKTGSGGAVSQEAANRFKAALDAMAAHDKANDWNEAACTSTAKLFLDAASQQANAIVPKLDQEVKKAQKEYADAMEALKASVRDKVKK